MNLIVFLRWRCIDWYIYKLHSIHVKITLSGTLNIFFSAMHCKNLYILQLYIPEGVAGNQSENFF